MLKLIMFLFRFFVIFILFNNIYIYSNAIRITHISYNKNKYKNLQYCLKPPKVDFQKVDIILEEVHQRFVGILKFKNISKADSLYKDINLMLCDPDILGIEEVHEYLTYVLLLLEDIKILAYPEYNPTACPTIYGYLIKKYTKFSSKCSAKYSKLANKRIKYIRRAEDLNMCIRIKQYAKEDHKRAAIILCEQIKDPILRDSMRKKLHRLFLSKGN